MLPRRGKREKGRQGGAGGRVGRLGGQGPLLHARGMNQHQQLLSAAEEYHQALPPRIREYLNGRGIPDVLVDFFLLGWTGTRISIPIFGREGQLVWLKFAKSPDDETDSPKMLASAGAKAELYGLWGGLYEPE